MLLNNIFAIKIELLLLLAIEENICLILFLAIITAKTYSNLKYDCLALHFS